ncbi:hypothetical protein KC19_10G116700 [Ceratodon purpureus]|uniref:Uncharacterized protein n=1 Tax=Ceratodon purpureus TaxID=3225 RepID=A0A8T0GRK0_CERPU|nr:hypothetical protein KC19_10G116700 [Ceratodon purpureus]
MFGSLEVLPDAIAGELRSGAIWLEKRQVQDVPNTIWKQERHCNPPTNTYLSCSSCDISCNSFYMFCKNSGSLAKLALNFSWSAAAFLYTASAFFLVLFVSSFPSLS